MKTTLHTTGIEAIKPGLRKYLLLIACFALCFNLAKGQIGTPCYLSTYTLVPTTDSLKFLVDLHYPASPTTTFNPVQSVYVDYFLNQVHLTRPNDNHIPAHSSAPGSSVQVTYTVKKFKGYYDFGVSWTSGSTTGICYINNIYSATGCADFTLIHNKGYAGIMPVGNCLGDSAEVKKLKALFYSGGSTVGATLCAEINWGDGTITNHCVSPTSGDTCDFSGIRHKYSAPGLYNYKVKIFSANGCYSDSLTNFITMNPLTCSSSLMNVSTHFTQPSCVSDTAIGYLDAVYYVCGSQVNSAGPFPYSIQWGDGQTSSGFLNGGISTYQAITKHKYSAPGTYSYKLKFSGAACNDSIIGSFTVNACGNLTGTVYNDANNDCNQNPGELGIANIPVKATLGTNVYIAWTDASGHYAFGNIPTGNYLIQINGMSLGYTITCGNSLPHITNVSTTGTTVENFSLHCNGFDIAVNNINLWNGFFPGQHDGIFPEVFMLNNACNVSVPGKVKVVLTPCIGYTSGLGYNAYGSFQPFPTPSAVIPAITGDTIVWNVSDINDLDYLSYTNGFLTGITTCTNAQVGDTACITVMVLPTNGDANPANDSFTRCFAIGVSYDPNYKEVSPKGSGVEGFIPQNTQELTYTLHFQNTGTAPAHNIYLLDTLSAHLDLGSIEIVSSSHPVQPYLLPNRTMKFMFANIMLPDSTHDELNSHGYVTYRIKLNGSLPLGTQIKNTGYIYFDYNAPVVTNTTLNTIAIPTGLKETSGNGSFKVYPNPAKDVLMVSLNTNEGNTITITDVLGKEIVQQKTNGLITELNVSNLQSGIYFVKVGEQVHKVMISK